MQYAIQRGGWGRVGWGWGVRRQPCTQKLGSKCVKKYDLHKLSSLISQCIQKKFIDETKCAKKQVQ